MGIFSGLNRGEISVISAKKVDPVRLCVTGDSEPQDSPDAQRRAEVVRSKLKKDPAPALEDTQTKLTSPTAAAATTATAATVREEPKCTGCCMAFSTVLSIPCCILIAASHTAVCVMMERRVSYTLNSVCRQVLWMAVPSVCSAVTLHGHLSEAMWSTRRNTWGQAWVKAIIANVGMWAGSIALCTAVWRWALPLFAAGRRLHRLYPIPCQPLETRMIVEPAKWVQGMGWSYFATATLMGNSGFAFVAAIAWYYDRQHFVMSPNGPYARRCMPVHHRKRIAHMAHVPFEP